MADHPRLGQRADGTVVEQQVAGERACELAVEARVADVEDGDERRSRL